MEKKDLEVSLDGRILCIFNNITNFVEEEDTLKVDSGDGDFEFTKIGNVYKMTKGELSGFPEADYFNRALRHWGFDSFKLQGRRTTHRHLPNAAVR